jgi:hypothetical protein
MGKQDYGVTQEEAGAQGMKREHESKQGMA